MTDEFVDALTREFVRHRNDNTDVYQEFMHDHMLVCNRHRKPDERRSAIKDLWLRFAYSTLGRTE